MSGLCVPLCGASKAYGRFDKPWRHEPECPVHIAWRAIGRQLTSTTDNVSLSPASAPEILGSLPGRDK